MPGVTFRRSWLCHNIAHAPVPEKSKEGTYKKLDELCVQVLPPADKVSQLITDNLADTLQLLNIAA